MRWTYTLLMYLYLPWALAHVAARGFRDRGYWRGLTERLGFGRRLPQRRPAVHAPRIWVHAVSVGEVQAAWPLLRALLAADEPPELIVTTTTATGAERLRALVPSEVMQRYAPYDVPGAVKRFLDRADPDLGIIFETEIWPNWLDACRRRDIDMLYANVRLSERSAGGYRRLARLIAPALGSVAGIAAQTPDDARRLVTIGAPSERLKVTGSTKFDVGLSPSVMEAGEVLRRSLGVDRSVWIAASTHEGEEELVLDAFAAIRREHPRCLLLLVPRHPERFARVGAVAARRGYRVGLRSDPDTLLVPCDVFLGDSMGELPVFYCASDVAFVGGSLVNVGGHNFLEPASAGIPIVMGPYLHNFADIAGRLSKLGAAFEVANATELAERVASLLHDANARQASGERGRHFVESNRGACARLLAMAGEVLQSRRDSRSGDPSRSEDR